MNAAEEMRAFRAPQILQGDIPSLLNPPPGCPFHPRCPLPAARCPQAMAVCREEVPAGQASGDGRWVACHLHR